MIEKYLKHQQTKIWKRTCYLIVYNHNLSPDLESRHVNIYLTIKDEQRLVTPVIHSQVTNYTIDDIIVMWY